MHIHEKELAWNFYTSNFSGALPRKRNYGCVENNPIFIRKIAVIIIPNIEYV